MGLIMNGFLKVPMQFFILLIGVMVFVFFQFNPVPLNFNPNNKVVIENSKYKEEYHELEQKLVKLSEDKKEFYVNEWINYEKTDKIFVYGKQVNDFHTVDKPQLGLLALGGVKELIKENKELKERITILENKN
jgi:hypothetical protein